MKSFVVLCLIVTLVVGTGRSEESSGFSGVSKDGGSSTLGGIDCYLFCGVVCISGPFECAVCIGKCLLFPAESNRGLGSNQEGDNLSFCNLGCATSRCTKFLTQPHSDEKKMEGCVDSCSQTCSNPMY